MRRAMRVLISVLLVVSFVELAWVLFFYRTANQKARACKLQLTVLRNAIDEYRKKTGMIPKNLERDLPRVLPRADWERLLRNPLDSDAKVRVAESLDGSGGWFYDPQTGKLIPNSKRVKVWGVVPIYRVENPQTW